MKRLPAALVAIGLLWPAAAAAASPAPLFTVDDPRIDEASGIAVGLASPGVVYVQNDSGDANRFFALDATTGATAATITVPGARNVDWEDIAVAPDANGVPSVWLADIGDNDAVRDEVQIYRVAEPHLEAAVRGRAVHSRHVDVWRLRYPGGAVNAESFAVSPDGTGYIVTKSPVGMSAVYRIPRAPDPNRVRTVRRIGTVRLAPSGTHGPLGVIGGFTATSAAISADGTVFAVRTYLDAYVWRLEGRSVAQAVATKPQRVTLPLQRQGEGLAVDGDRLLIDSEGVHQPVYAVRLPMARQTPSSGASATSATASSASPRPAGASATAAPGSGRWSRPVIGGVGIAVAAAVAAGAALVVRRRRQVDRDTMRERD